MRYYLAPVLPPEPPSPDPDAAIRDSWRLAVDDVLGVQGYSAVIPTHMTGLPVYSWGIAYVQSEDWNAVDADARFIRLFQGEEGAERSFDDVRARLSSARWENLSNARQQSISQPLSQRGVPGSVFVGGSLWALLQRVGRHLDPNFEAQHTHVNRGTVLIRPDPEVGRDTFTEAVDTTLTSHTPDVGAGWSVETASFTVIAANDNLAHTANTTDYARKGDDIASDAMDVSGRLKLGSNTTIFIGLAGRMPAGNFANAYGLQLIGAADPNKTLRIIKEVSGVITALATTTVTLNSNVFATCKLELRTAAKKGYFNSVEVLTTSDDSLSGNQYAGVMTNANINAGSVGRIDDFLSESVLSVSYPSWRAQGGWW